MSLSSGRVDDALYNMINIGDGLAHHHLPEHLKRLADQQMPAG